MSRPRASATHDARTSNSAADKDDFRTAVYGYENDLAHHMEHGAALLRALDHVAPINPDLDLLAEKAIAKHATTRTVRRLTRRS